MKKNILNELGKRIVFFDGGMGTLLQERGLEAGELPENWNLKHPDIIRELHRDYLNAGAAIILANTFGANEQKACRMRKRQSRKQVRMATLH